MTTTGASASQPPPELVRLADGIVTGGLTGPRSAVVRIERRDGGLVFEAARGRARPDTDTSMAPDTPFHHASIGKVFTSVLILQLAERGAFGRAGVDSRLVDLGVFPASVTERLLRVGGDDVSGEVTLRHLLTHTSGMRDAIVDDRGRMGGPAPRSLLGTLLAPGGQPSRRWRAWDPARPDDRFAGVLNFYLAGGMGEAGLWRPGAQFHYSDTGFVLLALVAEKFGGAPYHRLIRRRIAEPLGLRSLYVAYHDDPADLGPMRAPEAEIWFGGRALLSSGFSLSFDWGGGGTVSNAADLIHFWRGLSRGALFRRGKTFRAMSDWITPVGLKAPRTGVGLGLFRVGYPDGQLWGHSGAWGSRVWCDPDRDLILAGTVNQTLADGPWHIPMIEAAARARSIQ